MNQTQLGSLSLKLWKSLQDRGICSGQTQLLRSALDRIATGVYRRWLKCYREIGMDRLTALPHPGFCVPCQEDSYYCSELVKVGSRAFSEQADDEV
jgi:hypothetical protein